MKVYISNYLSNSVSLLKISSLTVEELINLGDNIYPHHISVDEETQLMYIPSSSEGILYVVDLKVNKVVDNVSIGGNLSQIMLCNDDLFIANEDSNSIYVLSKDKLNPIGIIEVGEMPHGFDFNENNNSLYISCINSIICIDTVTKEISKKINVEFKPWHIKIDKNKEEIYTSTLDGKVLILDENTMNIKKIIDGFLLPVEISFNYKYNKIYVADLGYKSIKVLDYNTLNVVNTIDVKGNPQGLCTTIDEECLIVSDTQRNSIKIYNPCDDKLIKELKVGKEPTTILCV